MYNNFLVLLRISAGIALLMLGIVGLVLPILQGWLFILIAIPLISPTQGKKLITWLKMKVLRMRASLRE